VLSRYLEPQAVRVYIKDTLMKPYMRERLGDHEVILRLCGVDANCRIAEHHIKPNGLRLMDGRVVAWGRARDWKAVLFAVFERSYARPAWRPFTAVLLHPSGKTRDPGYRALIDDAARRFEIEQLVWFED
jgi:hypothetical protein